MNFFKTPGSPARRARGHAASAALDGSTLAAGRVTVAKGARGKLAMAPRMLALLSLAVAASSGESAHA